MNRLFSLASIFLLALMASCNKGAINTPLPALNLADSAETIAELDSTSLGVYKGVLAGGMGRVKIYINNGDNQVKAYLAIDSLSDSLSCPQTFLPGNAITNATFTGRISSFNLSADYEGNNAVISNILVNNYPQVVGVIAHERSNRQVYCYEAPFTGSQSGHFNFIRYGTLVEAVAAAPNSFRYKGDGLITTNIFLINTTGGGADTVVFQGGIDATRDYFSGSWNRTSGSSGVFSGKRSL